ncbi:MAG: type II toxin-antitoxin system VapC family toxin [Burkholderiaceae bacterium]
MIGLDTNVLVRYIAQDDAKQSAKASRLIEALAADDPAFVPLVTLVELAWVLSGTYGIERDDIAAVIEQLLRSRELIVDRSDLVLQARRRYQAGSADFADCLIERIAHDAGCATTMTFDSKAAKSAHMTLVE